MKLAIVLAACGAAPPAPAPVPQPPPPPPPHEEHHLAELETPKAKPLLSIDWGAVKLDSDAEAQSVWQLIAPTGDDWQIKLDLVPDAAARPLAIALLHQGNFTCVQPTPPSRCGHPPIDEPQPAPTATLDDPCLRRLLALWSLEQLEPGDVAAVHDALRDIVQLPPPESLLVASAIHAIPEADQDARFELCALALHAGQSEVVELALSQLDHDHLVRAVRDLHDGDALALLSAETDRALFVHAVNDEKITANRRREAIAELVGSDDKLAPDVRSALVNATKSPDCAVAAAAARALDQHGEHRFTPARGNGAPPMRAMCVLASYEQQQRADETSLLRTWVPARGLELVKVTYDPYSDSDPDGDGDVHTARTIDLIARDEVVVPEVEDMVRALRHCTKTQCVSHDREFRFDFAGGQLARLEVIELPPCP